MGQLCSSSRGSAISRLAGIVLLLAARLFIIWDRRPQGKEGPGLSGQGFGEALLGSPCPSVCRTSLTRALTLSQSISGFIGVDRAVPLRNPEFFMGISTPKPSSGFGSGSCFTAKNLDQLSLPTPHCHKKSHCLFLP